jgi:predicted RNA binding protein YcfA (HicA-like mRNA interferase family)
MKRRELEKKLLKLGWKLVRHGSKHDIWTNGEYEVVVPRHVEINEYTAKGILKEAKGGI